MTAEGLDRWQIPALSPASSSAVTPRAGCRTLPTAARGSPTSPSPTRLSSSPARVAKPAPPRPPPSPHESRRAPELRVVVGAAAARAAARRRCLDAPRAAAAWHARRRRGEPRARRREATHPPHARPGAARAPPAGARPAVFALARPRQGLALTTIPKEGIDLVVSLDVSSSMSERVLGGSDTKMAAAQRAVADFVRKLEGDRIGLVIFQSRALTLSWPLTVDQAAIATAVENARSGLLSDGTAIGLGLAESLNLLRDSPAKSRVVVLLTDGQNNTGEVTPGAAAGARTRPRRARLHHRLRRRSRRRRRRRRPHRDCRVPPRAATSMSRRSAT